MIARWRIGRCWPVVSILALFVAGGCATVPAAPAAQFRVDCAVSDASVWIDDVLVGRVADWSRPGRLIRAGFHRVEIRHPNHYSHYAEIQVAEHGTAVVQVPLRPLLE